MATKRFDWEICRDIKLLDVVLWFCGVLACALVVFIFTNIATSISKENHDRKYPTGGRFIILSRFRLDSRGAMLIRDTTNHTEYIVVNGAGIVETYPTVEEK